MTEVKTKQKGASGMVNRFLARHIEAVLSIPGSRLMRRFVRATRDVRAAQSTVLDEILGYARDSVFGREHGFDRIRSYSDFRERVPVRDYEGHRPYVDRHARGEKDVLFPGRPFMYNRTSGTTALAKLIPVTEYNFKRTIRDRGKLWLYGLMRQFPGVYSGKDLTLVSPDVEGHTEDGTPFGSVSGLMYRNIPEFVKLVHTIPYAVMTIDDYDSKVYALLRFSVQSNVTVMLTTNPTTVQNLVQRADAWKQDLIRDVRDGTLRKDLDIDPAIRAEAESLLEPDPARARELDRIASSNERFRPADYWPDLKLVHTWKNGNCRLVIPRLEPWFRPGMPMLDFGYLATEILATDILDPGTDGSILQVLSGFYEFAPYEEAESGDARCLMAHELEVGRRYYVYVTTFSGLYRYDMHDVLEVVGRFNEAPIVRFLFKGKGITSITGEKLAEPQFIDAVCKAARELDVKHDFFVGFADAPAQQYILHIEFLDDYSDAQVASFGRAVDEALCLVNIEYQAKRKSDRLKPVEVVRMGKGFFERYRSLRFAEGAHDSQLKWLNLSGTEADRERLEKIRHGGES